jgi:mannose-6-phosphate isomerase-like protein (cupin superfamily)
MPNGMCASWVSDHGARAIPAAIAGMVAADDVAISLDAVPIVDANALPSIERLPGWHGRFFHSGNMTFAYYDIDADAVPLHEHHHEQEEVWNVIQGRLAVTIDGVEHIAEPGCAAIVPPDTPHSARVLGACRAIVVDHPLRDDMGSVRTD